MVRIIREIYCEKCGQPTPMGSNRTKYCRTCNRNRNAARGLRRNDASVPSEFGCIDGEGSGAKSAHRYVLLGTQDSHICDSAGLDTETIFSWLWEQFLAHPERIWTGFFLTYDFTQWLKGLPEDRARMLYSPELRRRDVHPELGPFPVYWGDWEFDILGNKRFKLRERSSDQYMWINDTGSFFQQSFLKVIDPSKWTVPICTPEEYEKIREGKENRTDAVLGPEMIEYNRLENEIHSRVLTQLDLGFKSFGVRLNKMQWFGPGQAASAWMKLQTEMPKSRDLKWFTPAEILTKWAPATYYGGWFEIMAHGHIPGVVHQYDINSAYPYVISTLPCLEHGRWMRGTGDPGDVHPYRIMRCIVRGIPGRRIGPVPYRDRHGNISRHLVTKGTWWQHEIEAARSAGLVESVEVEEYVQLDRDCGCTSPLAAISELYRERLAVGKDSPMGKARKTVYNSDYGKIAQSMGEDTGNIPYGNPIYASLITTGCRTQILHAIATHPEKSDAVVMVATDAVYFTSPHPGLPVSETLGEWSHESHVRLTLFKPGVYWDDNTRHKISIGESATFKARGINANTFARYIQDIDNHYAGWKDDFPEDRDPDDDRVGWHPRVKWNSGFSMVTAKQALQRGRWEHAGSVSDATAVQDADPYLKRRRGYKENGIYWSLPYDGWDDEESHPYEKRFGQVFDPEWRGEGITPDGWESDTLREIFDL